MKTRGTVFILRLPGRKGLPAGTPLSPARGRDVSWSPGDFGAGVGDFGAGGGSNFTTGQLQQELGGFGGILAIKRYFLVVIKERRGDYGYC